MEEVLPALGAGIVSTVICNPLDTFRVNYQLGNKIKLNTNYLYRGIQYGIIGIPTFWCIYFPLYKRLKNEINTPTQHTFHVVQLVHLLHHFGF